MEMNAFLNSSFTTKENRIRYFKQLKQHSEQESPANAKGTRDSSACMKAHCEQM